MWFRANSACSNCDRRAVGCSKHDRLSKLQGQGKVLLRQEQALVENEIRCSKHYRPGQVCEGRPLQEKSLLSQKRWQGQHSRSYSWCSVQQSGRGEASSQLHKRSCFEKPCGQARKYEAPALTTDNRTSQRRQQAD